MFRGRCQIHYKIADHCRPVTINNARPWILCRRASFLSPGSKRIRPVRDAHLRGGSLLPRRPRPICRTATSSRRFSDVRDDRFRLLELAGISKRGNNREILSRVSCLSCRWHPAVPKGDNPYRIALRDSQLLSQAQAAHDGSFLADEDLLWSVSLKP